MLLSRAKINCVVIAVLFTSTIVYSKGSRSNVDIKVGFDRTFYSLRSDSKMLEYKQSSILFQIPLEKCNQSIEEKIIGTYRSLLKESQKNQRPAKNDVRLMTSEGKPQSVPRGSSLGVWLRDLPNKIMYYKAEAQVLCKH